MAGAYLVPNWVYAIKGFHGAVLCIKYPSGEQDIRTLDLLFFQTEIIKILLYEPVSRAKRASKKSVFWYKWTLFVFYLIQTFMSEAYMFKHYSVDSARKYAYPIRFKIL